MPSVQPDPADPSNRPRRPEGVQLRARRSPKLMALGVLAVVLGALGAGALYTMNTDRVQVIAMASDVERGQVLLPEHLTTVEVPVGLATGALDPADSEQLLGQPARTDLTQGSYPRLDLVGGATLPEDEVLVGLRLPLGRMPVTTLSPGAQVRLVGLAEEFRADAVVVTLPAATADSETFVFDVRVRAEQADALTRLAATDQVSLVMTKEA